MFTKRGFEKALGAVLENADIEKISEIIDKIKSDFDEREEVVRRYGKEYDEETDEYTFEEREEDDVEPVDNEWERRYYDLKKEYVERFFKGDDSAKDLEEPIEDIEEKITIDDLLERRD